MCATLAVKENNNSTALLLMRRSNHKHCECDIDVTLLLYRMTHMTGARIIDSCTHELNAGQLCRHQSTMTHIQRHCDVSYQDDVINANCNNNYRPYEKSAVGQYDWQVRSAVCCDIMIMTGVQEDTRNRYQTPVLYKWYQFLEGVMQPVTEFSGTGFYYQLRTCSILLPVLV